jgi:hypothetical protein
MKDNTEIHIFGHKYTGWQARFILIGFILIIYFSGISAGISLSK